MLRRCCIWIVLSVLVLGVSTRALAGVTATITVGGAETQLPSGVWDSGNITLSFSDSAGHTYSETVAYGQFSTSASLASAFGAMFSNSYLSAGLCAYASGSSITFYLKGTATLGSPTVTNASPSFSLNLATWPVVPALSVASSLPTSTYGTAVTFTASISSGPVGSISFYDGGSLIGASTLSGTTAQLAVSSLAAGTHTITAVWGGSPSFQPVTSGPITQTVTDATPSIGLTSSNASINYGDAVTFTTTVSNGVTGIVTFYDNGNPIGDNAINGTTAQLTTSSLQLGVHQISASWPGNADYVPITSSSITETVGATDVITTFAGNGTAGYGGDYGLAINAELVTPNALALDTGANLYICDPNNYRIRKVTSSTGIITTVAGSGVEGFSGDNGPATSADIGYCGGLAVDSGGNLFFDDGNCRIRKVSPGGTITTVAGNGTCGMTGTGGSATGAEIYPFGVAVDGSGNLYLGNFSTNPSTMEMVSSSGTITIVPNVTGGSPVVDTAGNLYVYSNGVIQKYSSAGTNLGPVAGNGTVGYTGDGGPATNAEINGVPITVDSSGNLYLYASNNSPSSTIVRKVSAGTGIISTVAIIGGGEGCIGEANNVGDGCLSIDGIFVGGGGGHTVDSSGNVYAADFWGRRVRRTGPLPTAQTQASAVSAISCAPSTITFGSSSTCTASVSGGATGTVAFAYVNTATQAITYGGTVPLQGGMAGDRVPSLAAGAYSVVATYGGGGSYTPSVMTAASALSISKAAPTISWSPPSQITYGTPLGSSQLNAASSVPGVFVYTPSAGTVLGIGSHAVSASFTPADTTDYTTPASITQSITVTAAVPTVAWNNPQSIQYGTPLSSTQLNATANVAGTFAYTPAAGTILSIGAQSLTVVFTPTSSPYNSSNAPVSANVQLTVMPDAPTISSILANPSSVGSSVTIAGQNFGPSQSTGTVTFNGVAANVTSWSDQLITATVPVGASTGNVLVSVGGVNSNKFLFMVQTSCGH